MYYLIALLLIGLLNNLPTQNPQQPSNRLLRFVVNTDIPIDVVYTPKTNSNNYIEILINNNPVPFNTNIKGPNLLNLVVLWQNNTVPGSIDVVERNISGVIVKVLFRGTIYTR